MDNISHEWLIGNVPMPENYEYILIEFLKAKSITPKGVLVGTDVGVSLGGVLSSLLSNCALDGMENLVGEFRDKRFIDEEKIKYLKSKGLFKENKTCPFSKSGAWFVRYADDFIIGLRSQPCIRLLLLKKLKEFLKKRGLRLFKEEISIKEQKVGHKFDFLGWRFHFINPNRVNWMISTPKIFEGKLNN